MKTHRVGPEPYPWIELWTELADPHWRQAAVDRLDSFCDPAPPPPGFSINRTTNPWWNNKGADSMPDTAQSDRLVNQAMFDMKANPVKPLVEPAIDELDAAHLRLSVFEAVFDSADEGQSPDSLVDACKTYASFVLGDDTAKEIKRLESVVKSLQNVIEDQAYRIRTQSQTIERAQRLTTAARSYTTTGMASIMVLLQAAEAFSKAEADRNAAAVGGQQKPCPSSPEAMLPQQFHGGLRFRGGLVAERNERAILGK